MQIRFYGKIVNGKLTLNRNQVYDAYCAGLKDGSYFIQIHKAKGSPKTLEQLGYYFAACVPTVFRQMVEDGNENMVIKIGDKFVELPLTEDVVDKLLKQRYAASKGLKEFSKALADKLEVSDFIDWVIRWSAKYLGCIIPPPDTGEENE